VILLAVESATELVGAAVADESGPRSAAATTGRRRHAETLAPTIDFVCRQAGVDVRDVDLVAVDVGPGLFTGLRVGVATAKALGQGLGVPVLGVTSTEILAYAAFDAGCPTDVLAVVDARRAEVFCARYGRPGADGRPTVLEPPRVLPPGELARAAPGFLAVGDGALRYAEHLLGRDGVGVGGPSLGAPSPSALARLALAALAGGAEPTPAADVEALYLRAADARANFVERPAAARR